MQPRKHSRHAFMRKQFPFEAAEAITIYKSQGGIFPNMMVHLKKRFRRNEIYVSCSRATKLEGLFFEGKFIPPVAPLVHGPISVAVKELLVNKPVDLIIPVLKHSPETASTEKVQGEIPTTHGTKQIKY